MSDPMQVLTFDIEDCFQNLDNANTNDIEQWKAFSSRRESGVARLLVLCKKASVQATLFILCRVPERALNVIAEIARRGHEIGCHSYWHQLVHTKLTDEFERDPVMPLDRIEAATGIRSNSYRTPGFSITAQSAKANALEGCGTGSAP